jgi:hypothetical protein
MLKRVALLAPVALIVAACAGQVSSEEDDQGTPQTSSATEALRHPADMGSAPPGGAGVQPPIGSVPPGAGGAVPPIGSVPPGAGGVRPPIGSVPPGVGGVRPGVGWGRGRGFRRGWVNGRWAPGWGWNRGVWVAGGAAQYSCVTDVDCAAALGPGVAVCDFEPLVGLGQCVAPNWF